MQSRIREASRRILPDTVRDRRLLHRKPELAFEEHETAKLITSRLDEIGLPYQVGVAQTGVVARLDGAHPGPTTLLRADMDALPIEEENDFDFRSERPGRMHACGHDAHTACLLGAARILTEIRDDLSGSIRFVFQPSEERVPGGASVMIDEGVLGSIEGQAAPTTAFGQHVRPDLPAGTLGVRPGAFMAASDTIELVIRGQGGHAAEPHKLTSDAVFAAAQVITALQSVISRNCPPDVVSVLSFGRIVGDGASNVIPDRVVLEGTFRSMDESWRAQGHALIRRVATHTAQAFGAECDVQIRIGYPSLINDAAEAAFVRKAAVDFVGADRVIDLPRWFVAEDFANYLQHIPGCFYTLGVGNESQGITHGLHTSRFTIDESALDTGPGFMAYLAWARGAL